MGTRGWLTWRSRYFATALHTSPGEIREPHTGYRGDKAVCKRLDVLSIAMKLHKVQAKSRERYWPSWVRSPSAAPLEQG